MIPDYQSLMLPLLQLVADKQEHKIRDVLEDLATHFNLGEEDRKELLPSGIQPIFDNRVNWANTYLKKAGFLVSPRRATIVITQRGLDFLSQKPSELNVRYLSRFPEFVEFRTPKRGTLVETQQQGTEYVSTQTPEEILGNAYQKIRTLLAQELLNKVIELPPTFFEILVVELLIKMGYGGSIKDAGKTISKSRDEGIDGTIKEDKLGLGIIYIQAKRWQLGNNVGRKEIQSFVGALEGQRAMKGIFITTSSFAQPAIKYAKDINKKIALIDGEQLANLMIDYDIGVTKSVSYDLKKIDGDYFSED